MDAEPAPPNPAKEEIRPRNPEAWVMLGGRWRKAHVRHWYRVGGRWIAWLQHDRVDGRPWPEFAAYWYSPATLIRRIDGQPPPP